MQQNAWDEEAYLAFPNWQSTGGWEPETARPRSTSGGRDGCLSGRAAVLHTHDRAQLSIGPVAPGTHEKALRQLTTRSHCAGSQASRWTGDGDGILCRGRGGSWVEVTESRWSRRASGRRARSWPRSRDGGPKIGCRPRCCTGVANRRLNCEQSKLCAGGVGFL